MIDNLVYVFILGCLFATEFLFASQFFKASWYYFTDGADIRVCSLAQYFIYGLLFTTEVVSYLITGKASTLFIYVIRSHLVFSFFLLASCRLIGYRVMYSSPLLRNMLYILICFFFYFTVIMGAVTIDLSTIKSYTDGGNFKLISNVCMYLQTIKNYPKSIFIELIPTAYALGCFIIILSFDLKERRSPVTIKMDMLLGLDIVLSVITKIGTSWIYLDNFLICFMYIIPIFGFVTESRSVIKICQIVADENNKFKKLVKKSISLPPMKRKYNARVIAKMIRDNPELEAYLPNGKRYSDFNKLVKSFLG